MATKVKFSRVDTAANFTAANSIYASGELMWESDTFRAKVGDGVTAWNSLPYRFESVVAPVDSVNGQIGVVVLDKADVGLANVDNTSDANKPISTATQNALNNKYDASNPSGFETSAQLNARDTTNRDRSNHTGTQPASTITGLPAVVAANETDTTLTKIGNTLRYIGEDGTNQDIDLSTISTDSYTKVELDGGQLDNRYYTETEVNTLLTQLTYHEVVERDDPLINQTTTNEEYLQNNFVLPALGDYLCTITAQFSHDTTGSNFEGEAIINGTTYQFIEYEPKDSAGPGIIANTTTGGSETTGTDQRFNATFKKLLTNVSGTISAAFWFETQWAGVESTTYRCTIEMKRVN